MLTKKEDLKRDLIEDFRRSQRYLFVPLRNRVFIDVLFSLNLDLRQRKIHMLHRIKHHSFLSNLFVIHPFRSISYLFQYSHAFVNGLRKSSQGNSIIWQHETDEFHARRIEKLINILLSDFWRPR